MVYHGRLRADGPPKVAKVGGVAEARVDAARDELVLRPLLLLDDVREVGRPTSQQPPIARWRGTSGAARAG